MQNDNLQRLRNLVGSIDWSVGLKIWRKFFSFEHGVADSPAEIITDFGDVVIPPPRQTHEGGKKSKRSKKKNRGKKKLGNKSDEKVGDNTEEPSLNTGVDSAEYQVGQTVNSETSVENNINTVIQGPSQTGVATDVKSNPKETERSETQKMTTPEEKECNESVAKKPRVRENPWNPMMPSFRVTCNRNGDKHNFDSMTAASNFGGAIYRYFGWNVKMTEFDIEVILGIEDQEVTISLGLTKESLHRRNITHFGPTTLRPTIAYGMLR